MQLDNKTGCYTQVRLLFVCFVRERMMEDEDSPQKGMPAGVQVPLVEQRRRDGPSSSKPGSHS